MDKVAVFDTTLRDGEQAAGARLGAREKLEVARQLARLGVDVIEAGPNSSPEDFEAVRLIGQEVTGPTICALSRAVGSDIDACGKALARTRKSRIHTGIGVSDIHIAGKFRDDKYGKTMAAKKVRILQMAVEAVGRARGHVEDVEFYAEDAGRAELTYLFEVLQAVIEAGATVEVLNRTVERAEDLAKDLGAQGAGPLARISELPHDILINTTSVGLRSDATPVSAQHLRADSVVMDIVYDPEETRLLADARSCGALPIGGKWMLVHQAAEQLRLWTGRDAPIDVLEKAFSASAGN